MKKRMTVFFLWPAVLFCVATNARAQDIPGVGSVAGLASRVVKAIDLKIQRLQNETIVLQNAQKAIENAMSKLHLTEITGWVQQQKELYEGYYRELWQVKAAITYYHRLKETSEKQVAIVNAYKKAWGLLSADGHFNAQELDYMAKVYGGILDATLQNVDGLLSVVDAFTTQMDDAARLRKINNVARSVEENYGDLLQFNGENALLSLQRSRDENEAQIVKWMYGIK